MPQPPKLILPAGRSSIGKPESWPLSPETTRTLTRVAPSSIPILCLGCSGPAFGRLTGAIHQASTRSRLAAVDLALLGSSFTLDLPRGRAADALTLALDGIEHLDADGQSSLSRYLDEAAPRLISATQQSVAELQQTWRPDLFSLLAAVTVDAPSLAHRGDDLARLVEERLASLSAELGRPVPPRLSASASAALRAHGWPGDVAELDAVLLQTLLACEGDTIDAGDLVWPAASSPTAELAPSEPIARFGEAERRPAERLGTLEAVAIELAHQLKNPLVTVKTFVENSTRLGAGEDLERFREMTVEAIARIDEGLEELLAFSRLGTPARVPLDVMEALEQALRHTSAAFERKEATLADRPAIAFPVEGDPEYLRFALGALLRHVAEVIEPRSRLEISTGKERLLGLSYSECGTATHLRGATGEPGSSFPLALLLVRGALTRMGGGMCTERVENHVTIELRFPGV